MKWNSAAGINKRMNDSCLYNKVCEVCSVTEFMDRNFVEAEISFFRLHRYRF